MRKDLLNEIITNRDAISNKDGKWILNHNNEYIDVTNEVEFLENELFSILTEEIGVAFSKNDAAEEVINEQKMI